MNLPLLVQAVEEAEYETRSYSGRAMYGERCLGVDCDNPARAAVRIARALVSLCEGSELEEILEAMEDAKTDSMGRDAILYFPSIAFPQDYHGVRS